MLQPSPLVILSTHTILLLLFSILQLTSSSSSSSTNSTLSPLDLFPTPSLHQFFYAWYGAPPHDIGYLHWTHSVLPHWTASITAQHRSEPYVAPGDPGVTYHPFRPLYSSHDPATLSIQLHEMAYMGTDVVIVSWWGAKHKNTSMDGQGVGSDHCMPAILDAAQEAGLKVAIHLEPYPLRSEYSVHDDLVYLWEQYGEHPAWYRHPVTGQCLIYAYDSYHMTNDQWRALLTRDGRLSIRHTPLDCIFIALVLDSLDPAIQGSFDGAYSYFAADGFTPAATSTQWPTYLQRATAHGLLFVPSVAPGYDDTRLRPWNGQNRRARGRGEYYRRMWDGVRKAGNVSVVTVTSYNEWGEGTQIEPARPFVTDKGERLQGYGEGVGGEGDGDGDGEEMMYVELTKELTSKWKRRWRDEGDEGEDVEGHHHAELR